MLIFNKKALLIFFTARLIKNFKKELFQKIILINKVKSRVYLIAYVQRLSLKHISRYKKPYAK
jgi:predicted HAD superfamily phosphohydrolase YqeG